MKRTQWLALFRDIKSTIVSFLSILLFVALGMAVFLGIKWNEPALANTVDAYYDAHNFQDFLLTFPYGLTPDDVSAVKALDTVADAEGAFSAHGTVLSGKGRYVLVVQSLTERANTVTVLDGVLPAEPNEIGIEAQFAEAAGLAPGDTISIEAGSGGNQLFTGSDFTITAIVEHPAYIRPEAQTRGLSNIGDGTVDYYAVTPPSAFNPAAFDNCFSQIVIRGVALSGMNSFGGAYEARAAAIAETIKAVGAERAGLRSDALFSRYSAEIADGEKKLSEAENELESGKRDYEAGKQTFLDAEQKIADGEKQIADNEQKLLDAQKKYDQGLAEYKQGEAELKAARSKLARVLDGAGFGKSPAAAKPLIADKLKLLKDIRQLIEIIQDSASTKQIIQDAMKLCLTGNIGAEKRALFRNLLDLVPSSSLSDHDKDVLRSIINAFESDPDYILSDAEIALLKAIPLGGLLNKINNGIADLNKLLKSVNSYLEGAGKLAAAKRELEAGAAAIEKGRAELEAAKLELEAAKLELENGRQELSDAEQAIGSGELELEKNRATLEDAKTQLAAFIRQDNWVLQMRSDNPGCAVAQAIAATTRKLCYSMALLFVFVGLMVCYTSVSRIVNESQTMTGVQKALGFRNKEVMAHYMTYSILAVGLGALLGALLGYFVIESIVNVSYARRFVFDSIKNVFVLSDLLGITAVEMLLICFATWLPCRKLLKRQAVDLLRGDDHGGGRTRFYEKMKFWQKCSLYTQTTINNLANDSARVIASLVGVAGCTALIVMALSSQLALVNTPKKHFADVWRYDARLVSDSRVEGAQDALRTALEREDVRYTPLLQTSVFIESADGKLSKADLIVPEDPAQLAGFIDLNDWKSKRQLTLTDDGALISRTYAKHQGIREGDSIRLLDMKGQYHSCVIAGVTEHYLSTNQLVMSGGYYARVMDAPAAMNTFYLNFGEADPLVLQGRLSQVNGYFSLVNENAKWSDFFDATFKSTSLIVYICLLLSAAMALLVLLNLNVVFINEKAKELIIMRINGFSIQATKRYVYRDNIVLTVLGILLGIAIGLVLAAWVLGNLQRPGDNFYTAPNLTACLAGAGLSGVFSLITNLIALKRVDKLKVSDIGRM